MYIYKFTHIESNRCYIGQTIQDPNYRKWEHLSHSRYTKKTHHFHNALQKYGVDAFTFEVIASAKSIDELNTLEEHYIRYFDSIDNGFNIRQGGGNKRHNPESIARMKEAQKLAHARRREAGTEGGWKRKDGGAMKGKSHPNKGGSSSLKGKTLILVDGKRKWSDKGIV